MLFWTLLWRTTWGHMMFIKCSFGIHCIPEKIEGSLPRTGEDVSVLCSCSQRHHGGKAALEQTQGLTVIYARQPQKFLLPQFLKSNNYKKYLARSKRLCRSNHIGSLAVLDWVLKKHNLLPALNHHQYATKWPYACKKKTFVQVVYGLILPPLLTLTTALFHQ